MLRPNEDDMIEIERLKFEVDILVKLAYKFQENCDGVHALYLREQFNTVCYQFNDTRKKFFLDN